MSQYIHGNNVVDKVSKHTSGEKKDVISKIHRRYLLWRQDNESITGILRRDITKKTKLLNRYKNFVHGLNKKGLGGYVFTFQSKLEPTILEEFLYYLFKDIPVLKGKNLKLGPVDAYVEMGFAPNDIESFEKDVSLDITTKDQDFAISRPVFYVVASEPTETAKYKELSVPIVAIEVKTYLDKTMLVGAAGTAERLKAANPNALFLLVTETTGVGKGVVLGKTKIDEIFVIRKQRSIEKDMPGKLKPIDDQVVWDLFSMVRDHLKRKWIKASDDALSTGRLINRSG